MENSVVRANLETIIEENGTSFETPDFMLGHAAEYLIRSNVNSATEIVESTERSTMSTTDTSSNISALSPPVDSASETTDNIIYDLFTNDARATENGALPTARISSENSSSPPPHESDNQSPQISNSLRTMRLKNVGRLIVASLNINSIANKIDRLEEIVRENVDILIILETKIDNTFPTAQFRLNGFSEPYRKDRNRNGGGVLIFVRNTIPSRELSEYKVPDKMEGIF